jgi:hypothetical protein
MHDARLQYGGCDESGEVNEGCDVEEDGKTREIKLAVGSTSEARDPCA